MVRFGLQVFSLTMFVVFDVNQVPAVELVEVIVPGHPSRAKLADLVQGLLGIFQGMCDVLDIWAHMVWRATDQLRLEREPVDGHLAVWTLGLFELLHHHMGWSQPSDLDQISVFRIPSKTIPFGRVGTPC